MINLKKLKVKKELKHLEKESFYIKKHNPVTLDKKCEKIWVYIYENENANKVEVYFQIVLQNKELKISFQTESHDEQIRVYSSEVAHELKNYFKKRKKEEVITLSEEFIKDFTKYKKNIEAQTSQKQEINELYETMLSEENIKQEEIEVNLFGKDGLLLGKIMEELKIGEINHESENCALFALSGGQLNQESFIEGLRDMGFSIKKNNKQMKQYNFEDLIDSGLISID